MCLTDERPASKKVVHLFPVWPHPVMNACLCLQHCSKSRGPSGIEEDFSKNMKSVTEDVGPAGREWVELSTCFAQSLLCWSYKGEGVASGSFKSKESLCAVGSSFLRGRPETRIGRQVVVYLRQDPRKHQLGRKEEHWERVCYKAHYPWGQRSILSPQNSGQQYRQSHSELSINSCQLLVEGCAPQVGTKWEDGWLDSPVLLVCLLSKENRVSRQRESSGEELQMLTEVGLHVRVMFWQCDNSGNGVKADCNAWLPNLYFCNLRLTY